MSIIVSLVAAFAISAASASPAPKGAGPGDFIAAADIRPEFEVPPVTLVDARGSAGLHYNSGTGELSWTIEYQGLTSTPSMAHIHGPAMAGQNAAIIVDLLANSGSADSPMVGSVQIDPATAANIADGLSYINLHTAANMTGEARGQVERLDVEAYQALMTSEIRLVGAAQAESEFTGNITITHGLPIETGDVVIALIHQSEAAVDTFMDNNGIVAFSEDFQEATGAPGSDDRIAVFSRVAGASEADTYRWTSSETAGNWRIQIRVYRGVDTSQIWDVPPLTENKTTGESTTATAAEIVTVNDRARAIGFVAGDHMQGHRNPTNGYRNLVTNLSGQYALAAVDKEIASAGATGTFSLTLANNNDWTTLHFALKPRDAAAGGTADFQYDRFADALTWTVAYSGLTDTPSGIHIHAPTNPGTVGAVALDLLAMSGGSDSPVVGSLPTPDPALLGFLFSGRAYVDLHTPTRPGAAAFGDVIPAALGETVFKDSFEGE